MPNALHCAESRSCIFLRRPKNSWCGGFPLDTTLWRHYIGVIATKTGTDAMTYLTLIGFAGVLGHSVFDGAKLPGFRYSKVGGLRFLRFGRLQLSFCVCKASI